MYDPGDGEVGGYTYRIDCTGKIIFIAGTVNKDSHNSGLKCYGMENTNTFRPEFGILIHDAKQARQLQNLFEDIEDSFHLMEDFADEEDS